MIICGRAVAHDLSFDYEANCVNIWLLYVQSALQQAEFALVMSAGFVVFVIRGDPVLSKSFLCGTNIELSTADYVAHKSLQSVLGLGIPFGLDTPAGLLARSFPSFPRQCPTVSNMFLIDWSH
jgi:hypothetical protein